MDSICKRCGKDFNYDALLKRHLNNKNICPPLITNILNEILIDEINNRKSTKIINNKKYYICKYCNKHLTTATGKSLHQLNCNKSNKDNQKAIYNLTNSNNNSITNNTDNSINIQNNNNNTTNNNIILDNVDLINSMINQKELSPYIRSFPSYTIGHLYKDNNLLLNDTLHRCKGEDLLPTHAQHSQYNFVLELFKVILSVNDFRTKNMYIDNITDDIAHIYLDKKFYNISVEKLFKIICSHLPTLVKIIRKKVDTFKEMDKDDKDYLNFSCLRFTEFIKSDNDKTYLITEILNCIYKNKNEILNVINSEEYDLSKLNNDNIIEINTNETNYIRKSLKLPIKNQDEIESVDLLITDKKYRINNSINTNDTITIEEEHNIKVNFDKAATKIFPDNKICYKASYRDIELWYNQTCMLGCLSKGKNNNLIPINDIKNIIDALYNNKIEVVN